MKAKKVRGFLS